MKRTIEREIKLRAGTGFALPRELGDPLAPRSFSSTYHDTSDHRLAASGFTLRYRAEHGSGAWQLKLPRAGDRLELELPGSPEAVRRRSGTCWRRPPAAGRWLRWRRSTRPGRG